MDLLLWRHAEAHDGSPDHERLLTPRGEKQARRMAKWLTDHAPAPLRILVSPALRTQQTVQAWTDKFETCQAVGVMASGSDLLTAANWPNRDEAVLIVGHQPSLGHAASLLLNGVEEDISFRKGALWWFKYRDRDGEKQAVLRAVMTAELL